ncbi:hypothetical protein H1P_110058 [Hyella patelloides LEGE 07179]|uniref:Uncharacterized protein n=1 Tax=Hyella patelloides LEGE 07179 TaxID=945734 RepID=A0A563VJK2_9CYAN|nr:hypothetical protein H1P_110058 [Hyella patelloides LEGE 07179]
MSQTTQSMLKILIWDNVNFADKYYQNTTKPNSDFEQKQCIH